MLFACALYLPVALTGNRYVDDASLLVPLFSTTDFWAQYPLPSTLDFQPVRDISLYADVLIGRRFGLNTFHLTNLALFLIILAGLHTLLQRRAGKTVALLACLTLACHPLLANVVCWISARKHLLGALFSVWYLWALQDRHDQRWMLARLALFALAALSHPLYVALMACTTASFLLAPRERSKIGELIATGAFAAWVYHMNHGRYSAQWSSHALATHDFAQRAGEYALSFGRYFFNFFVPYKVNVFYHSGSLENVLGLPIAVICVLLLGKHTLREDRPLLAGLLGPLCVAIWSIPFFYVNDTYAILPLICLVSLLAFLAQSLYARHPRPIAVFLVILLGLQLAKSRQMALRWSDTALLAAANAHEEPTDWAISLHMSNTILKLPPREGVDALLRYAAQFKGEAYVTVDTVENIARSVFAMKDTSATDKLALLGRLGTFQMDASVAYYQAVLHAREGRRGQALELVRAHAQEVHAYAQRLVGLGDELCAEDTSACDQNKSAKR